MEPMSRAATGTSGRNERRRTANERYRQGFLAQAATELREFALLLTEEPDAQESVAFELHRLAETAEALELSAIARAAADAAEELTKTGVGVAALRRVANAIRHTGGRLRIGPICVVGITGAEAEALQLDAELCCEPVYLFDDLAAFARGLHTEQPSAVVLPVEAIDAIAQLVGRESFPVLVHGGQTSEGNSEAVAFEAQIAALASGAHGYLERPFRLSQLVRIARWRNQSREELAEVVLVAEGDPAREELEAAFEAAGMSVQTASNPAELTPLLGGPPHAVVLGAWVAGVPALSLAMLVRAHPRCTHLPILVTGRPDDASALRGLGVDDVMRPEAQPAQVAQRVRDRIGRMRNLPWERDPASGMPTRLGVLNLLDAELAIASRTGMVLAVSLVELDGLRTAVEAFGATALANARRRVQALFREMLRRTDAHGELAPGELLVAMPVCSRAVASQRMEEIAVRFAAETARDPQLKGVQLLVGVADTTEGLRTVAVRAERELRSGGSPPRVA
jgi:DNA-binding response OmpR family regulator